MNRLEKLVDNERKGEVSASARKGIAVQAIQLQRAIDERQPRAAEDALRRLARSILGDDAEIIRTTEAPIRCPDCRQRRALAKMRRDQLEGIKQTCKEIECFGKLVFGPGIPAGPHLCKICGLNVAQPCRPQFQVPDDLKPLRGFGSFRVKIG